MNPSLRSTVQLFDPYQEYSVVHRRLPHWSQAGTISFITWRTWDSIPKRVLQTWIAERDAWLLRHSINPARENWRSQLRVLGTTTLDDFQLHISDRWNDHLDACHGACVLQNQELSQIVAGSLAHFDGDRYELTDFVIMPNHVHLLIAFPNEESMLQQCDSWKHFTASAINRVLGREGRLWQQDGFDHLVRSVEQFEYLRRYIRENPRLAMLQPGEFFNWSKVV